MNNSGASAVAMSLSTLAGQSGAGPTTLTPFSATPSTSTMATVESGNFTNTLTAIGVHQNDAVGKKEALLSLAEITEIVRAMERASEICSVAIPLIIAVILLIGLLGNLMVIYVTLTTQRIIKHPVHSMLVVNLAAADLIYLFANGPYYIVNNLSHKWMFTDAFCPFFHFTSVMAMSAGIFTMCSLAWMRFMALIHPFVVEKSLLPTRTGGVLMIALVWGAAVVMAVPNAAYYRVITFGNSSAPDPRQQCIWEGEHSLAVYMVVFLVITYALPFLLVTICYIMIGREVLCFMKRKSEHIGQAGKDKSGRSEYTKTTIMVLFLIVAFLVCWFPFHLFSMIQVAKSHYGPSYAMTRYVLKMVSRCMSYAHACVNPIIYTFAAPGFRRTLYASMTCEARRLGGSSAHLYTMRRSTPERTPSKRGHRHDEQLMLPANGQCERTLVSKLSISPSQTRDGLKGFEEANV